MVSSAPTIDHQALAKLEAMVTIANRYVYTLHTVYTYITRIQYTHTLRAYSIHIHYAHIVYTYIICIQFTHTVYSYSTGICIQFRTQNTHTVNTYSLEYIVGL